MKKLLLLLSISVGFALGASAQACTASDTTHLTGATYSYPSTLPCFTRGTAYSESVSIKCPSYSAFGQTIAADSVHIDTITNLPLGMTYSLSPASHTLYKGQYGCIHLSGVPTDSGSFTLHISARICFTLPAPIGSQCVDTNLSTVYPITLNTCVTTGISDVAANVAMNIYPNPNQGNFTVTVSAAERINGDLSVMDQLGRVVYTQAVDVTGTKQIPLELSHLSAGSYILMISSNGSRSVKQFSIK